MSKHPILIVDDQTEVLGLLRTVLKREGYEVLMASTVAMAKQVALTRSLALILLDLGLPDGDGLDLCRWLKRQPQCQDVPVIVCSGRDTPETRAEALTAGAVDFIGKPFELARFRERIRAHLHSDG